MKYWSLFILLIFLNFTALPSIAAMIGWELPQTNMVINEEENHCSSCYVIYEKALPEPLNVHDFLKFFETDHHKKAFFDESESLSLNPFIPIYSPPPEI